MRLTDLVDGIEGADPEISALTADSRQVRPGSLFFALPGVKLDGRRFIEAARAAGAAAVITDAQGAAEGAAEGTSTEGAPVLAVAEPRSALARAAARFFGTQPAVMAAVTGTNGKTSTASFTRQLWALGGHRAASLGTLGVEGPDGLVEGSMTTPDPVTLHQALAGLARDGITRAAMEASSHGLDQHRLDGVVLQAAAFTNLTQDHLDYHGDMAGYLKAKARLFGEVLPAGRTAVLNADSPVFAELSALAGASGHPVLDYGREGHALRLVASRLLPQGQHLSLDVSGRRIELDLPLVGAFQAENALAAAGLALATGEDETQVFERLARLRGVRGRVEQVATLASGAAVYVDYAHTPDGLEKILTALRPHAEGRLIVAFGAGGDRDRTKRPLMGAICARLADIAVVTDDNPRGEDPAGIRKAILAACPEATEIGDRAAAIAHGIGLLRAGDIFVIAGKGHEQGQTVAGTVHPFDDAAVARKAVARLSSRVGA